MHAVGDVVKAREMIEGHWYSIIGYNRCVAGGWLGKEKRMRLVFIDGDTDMQSCQGVPLEEDVVAAEPKF